MSDRRASVPLVLVVAVLSLGVSGPAIRFASASALAIVVWRLALAWPFLALVAVARREVWPWRRGVAAGVCLAVHWMMWALAVKHTSITSACVLISTGALWAAVLAGPVLGEVVRRRQWYGLAIALVGVIVVVTARQGDHHSILGDLFALAGSLAWVAYVFIGRQARSVARGFWGYTATVYLAALVVSLVVAAVTWTPLGPFEGGTWTSLVVLALFPTLLGHGGFNFLLRFMGSARVGLWSLSEPVLATFLAWPLFGEVPPGQVIVGGVLALAGVALGAVPSLGAAAAARAAEGRA